MSKLVEINFDGIVGPSHNYAGLSLGNIASASHGGDVSYPRAAALQGVAKMRGNHDEEERRRRRRHDAPKCASAGPSRRRLCAMNCSTV